MSSVNVCEICHKDPVKYSCPRCNILYCSVACYKSADHLECSESFYKECIAEEMLATTQSKQGAPEVEKSESMKKMYEILMRMQSVESNSSTISDIDLTEQISQLEDLEQSDLDSDDDADSEDTETECQDLAQRLTDVNLNDANAVWEKLTDVEKKDFEKLIQSGDISKIMPEYKPWWEEESEVRLIEELDKESTSQVICEVEAKKYPKIIDTIKKFDEISKKTPDPCVKHNLTNILAAYTFTSRFFNGDHLNYPHESAHCVVSICANLKSNWNYENNNTAIESVALEARNEGLRFDQDDIDLMKSDLNKLYNAPSNINCSQFVENQEIIILKQNLFILAALSDLYRLFMYAKLTKDNMMREKYSPGIFSKRFADHEINNFGELKRSKISVYLKKLEYLLAYSNNFVIC